MAFAGLLVGPEHPSSSLQEHLWLVMALPSCLSVPLSPRCLIPLKISSSPHSTRIRGMLEEETKRVHSSQRL